MPLLLELGFLRTNFQVPSFSITLGLLGLIGYLELGVLLVFVFVKGDLELAVRPELFTLLFAFEGIVRFGILKDFIQSNTCSLFDDFRSGINGITESELDKRWLSTLVGIYLAPLLNRFVEAVLLL